jgi:PAS domain S-box-containing protein
MFWKRTEKESLEYAESVINTVREPLIVLDQDLRVVSVSRSFYEFFKVNPEDTVGQLIYDLGNKQWDIPKLRELLETILPEKATFENYEVEHDFAGIGKRTMLLNARQIQRVLDKERIILLAIEDITERKEIEAGLERTRKELEVIKKAADEVSEYAESVINTVREPLIVLDQDLRVVSVSRSFYEFFKVNPEDTMGQLIYDLGNKQWDIPKLRELLETILPGKATFDNYEVEHDFAGIGKRTMLLNARQIQRVLGKERIILLAIEDITDRKRTEEKIKASLLEKETMLKEIHHRVKNNLQVISSLLALQSSHLQDEKAKEMFQNSMDRVKTIANIHTMLYQSENLSRVDFGGFIKDLVDRLKQSYGIGETHVEIHVNVSDVSLTIETSIPCGLILNELVSNALKYAFPEGRGGEVNISMTTTGEQFVLTVRDNGIGFPEVVDFQNTRSLGLKLVNLLVGQMNGAIDLHVEEGSTFTIIFPTVSKGV